MNEKPFVVIPVGWPAADCEVPDLRWSPLRVIGLSCSESRNTGVPVVWPHPEQHPGAYLERRFLEPLGLSASELSRAIGTPRSRVSEILSGKRGITADTAIRLGRYLQMEPGFWMSLQAAWDLSRCTEPTVVPADVRGFLVGPAGAQRLPEHHAARVTSVHVADDLLARLRAAAAQAPQDEDRELKHVQYRDGQHAWVSEPR
ncbi:MAG: HigA family addiction module antitoxin [Myxococcota bacterium]